MPDLPRSAEPPPDLPPSLGHRLSGLPQGPGVSVMRSAQLDAQRLDEELKAMLSVQMQRALSMISPVSPKPKCRPEPHQPAT